jgi:hypothetical protein
MYFKRLYEGTVDERAPIVERLKFIEQKIDRASSAKEIETLRAERTELRSRIRVRNVVRIMRATRIWRPSPSALEAGEAEGWLTRSKGLITIHGEKGDVALRVVRTPGHYCCTCEERFDDSGSAQQHVKRYHPDGKSPDPQNPSGYRRDNAYECVLIGAEIEDMSPEEAAAMAKGVRDTLAQKLSKSPRYADARALAEKRNAAKPQAEG